MMRSFPINTKLLPVLLLFLFIAGSAAADGPKEINTEKGPHHRSVFDMPVYVVLPEGCAFVKSQAGCVDKTKKYRWSHLSSVFLRCPSGRVHRENLKKADMELKMKDEFIWNGSSAMLMKIFQKKGSGMVGNGLLSLTEAMSAG